MHLSPRLSAIVDGALQYRITEIVAPAGFGKTVLLDQITSDRGFLLAAIRPERDPVFALMRALCQAVSEDFPDLLRALPEALKNVAEDTTELTGWFCQSIADKRYSIAVDDLHHLRDDEAATRLLCNIVEQTRANVSKWVLTSRTWARLPTVEWTARGEEGPSVGESDLLLSASDLEHIAGSMQITLTKESAAEIATATKGWPLLSIYAARLIQQGHSAEEVVRATSGRGIGAVADQILAAIGESERRLLLAIALLDGASPEDLDVAHPASAEGIFRLVTAGAPISQGSDRRWRLHDALRDYFLTNSIIKPSEVNLLASAFEDCRRFDQALRVAVAVHDSERIAKLLERNPQRFIDADDPALLRTALSLVPLQVIQDTPELSLIRGIEDLVRGDSSTAMIFLGQAAKLGDPGLKTYAKARRLLGLMESAAHVDETREAARELSELPLPSDNEQACEVLGILATALSALGDEDGARQAIEAAITSLAANSDPKIEARTYLRAAQVASRSSDPSEVDAYTKRAISLSERHGLFITLFLALRMRLLVVAPVDESQAIDCTTKALLFARKILSSRYIYLSELSIFAFACRSGNLEEARFLRRRLLPVPTTLKARLGGTISIMAAQLALLEESYWEAATQLADVRGLGTLEIDGTLVDARQAAFQAQSALLNQLTGSEEAAIDAARRVLGSSSQLVVTGLGSAAIPELEISQITAAAVLGVNGKMSEAEEVLGRLTVSAHEEYRRDLARWTRAVLTDPDAEPSESAMRFAKGIIVLIQRVVATSQREALTPAERRVLESLALGRSNKEIAAITGKSVKTVDNQVSAILRKLQARSRGEAVARARSTGALRA